MRSLAPSIMAQRFSWLIAGFTAVSVTVACLSLFDTPPRLASTESLGPLLTGHTSAIVALVVTLAAGSAMIGVSAAVRRLSLPIVMLGALFIVLICALGVGFPIGADRAGTAAHTRTLVIAGGLLGALLAVAEAELLRRQPERGDASARSMAWRESLAIAIALLMAVALVVSLAVPEGGEWGLVGLLACPLVAWAFVPVVARRTAAPVVQRETQPRGI